MKHLFLSLTVATGLLAANRALAQGDTNAAPATDYPSFSSIYQHSIFNPSRVGGTRRSSQTISRYTRIDSFTLVGTMSYEKGQFAFFDGSSSSYRKTLNVGQTIAGYKIAEITPDSIKLAASSNQTINLPVGTQMRRPEGGLWTVAGRAEPTPGVSTPSPDGSTPAAPGATTPATAPSGGESDAMKRLMLKRLTEQ